MPAQSKPVHSFQWSTPLDLNDAVARRDEVVVGIERAKRSRKKEKSITFHVSSPHDYLARQLVFAAQRVANEHGIAVAVTCETGSWTSDSDAGVTP